MYLKYVHSYKKNKVVCVELYIKINWWITSTKKYASGVPQHQYAFGNPYNLPSQLQTPPTSLDDFTVMQEQLS